MSHSVADDAMFPLFWESSIAQLLTLSSSEVPHYFATGSHDGSEVNASQLDRGQVAGDLLPEKPMVGGPGLSNAPQL